MSLKAELDAVWSDLAGAAPDEVLAALSRANLDLAASGATDGALKAGDRAPDFDLANIDGRQVRLSTLLARGPVVVSFYRGGWCPFCARELKALQAVSSNIQALGASLVAISPETLTESISTAEANALDFLILSDVGGHTAQGFGIAFDLAPALRPIYASLGHALPDRNGVASWRLPMPATFIIGRDGLVVFAHIDSDYRNRLEPDEIVRALSRSSVALA
jgi:peroxiredoxin